MHNFELNTKEGLKMAAVYMFQYGVITESEQFELIEKINNNFND
jgi:hypothetical protein